MRFSACGRQLVTGAILAGSLAVAAAVPLSAESGMDEAAVQKQLRQILKNQQDILTNQTAILQKFDAVMEELRIIKIRATLRGS